MTRWGGRQAQRLAELVVTAYGPVCCHCRGPIDLALPRTHPRGLSVEHLVPRSLGGTDEIGNLRPAHLAENISRGNRTARPTRRPRANPVFSAD